MENVVFQSNLFFDVLDYSISHKVLLLRGTDIIESNGEYISHTNIDLLFGSTQYIQMPTWFEDGIKIIKGVVDIEVNGRILLAKEYFELHNKDNIYYIESYGMEILENSLDTAESSIDSKKYRDMNNFVPKENIELYPHLLSTIEIQISNHVKQYPENWLSANSQLKKEIIKSFMPQVFILEDATFERIINEIDLF